MSDRAGVDLISNMGGPSADRLIENGFDIGVLRPWKSRRDGKFYHTRNVVGADGSVVQKVEICNTPTSMSYDSWKLFDQIGIGVLTSRLRLIADLRSRGLTYNLPNGMAHSILQYQTIGDIGRATISMDPIRRSEADRPTGDTAIFPLPLIHKDFDFTAREIMQSRQGNIPLDTTSIEIAYRKVAEEAEMLATGTAGPFTYGGGTIYGLTNLPSRATKTDMVVPDGTNGPTVLANILTLRQALIDDKHRGPFILYVNSQWPQFLDTDYSTVKGEGTLRQRILALTDIQDIQVLDFLPTTKYHAVLVEMDRATARVIVGLDATTVQWESDGGMMKHFKVMAMLLVQFRADTAGNSGVAHGRTA